MPERGPDEEQDAQGELNLSDGSGGLFSMYLNRTYAEDKEMVESWKGDAEGMLVFTGLFSAAVAALLALSVPSMQRNPLDTNSFYLARMYQHSFTQPDGSQPPIPSTLTDPILPFTPPTSSVWVNGLWFSSLVISLTCGLLATLLQQWARRYLRVAYPRHSPDKRARIRAFYRRGVEELHIPWTVQVLPALLHVSLFLFFGGLSVFLFNLHLTIFKVVTTWIGVCAILYIILTFLPVIRKDSPYAGPLSSSFYLCLTGIRYIFFHLFQRFPNIDPSNCLLLRGEDPRVVPRNDDFSHSMTKTAEKYALKLGPSIDCHSLLWTFETLDEDSDLEKFFEGLPRLCDSETGKYLNLQQEFITPNTKTLASTLIEMMNRTLSSNLATELVKQRRLIICTKAIESTSLFRPLWILRRVLIGGWHRFLGCIEFGLYVQNWKEIDHPVTLFYRQCVAALTISIVQDHDERWYQLVGGLSETLKSLLHDYPPSDDSILLASAIFIARRTVQTYSGSAERHRSDIISASSKTLEAVCKLNIRNTLPELWHEFCGVWNKLVDTAQSDPLPHHGIVATSTLKNLRKLYIALHLHECSTSPTAFHTTKDDRDPILDNPRSYPMCTVASHHLSEPIPGLQFDEPTPEARGGTPIPNMTPMVPPVFSYSPTRPLAFPTPLLPLTFPTPLLPSAPYDTMLLSTHYGQAFDTYSYLGAPPSDAAFRQPQPTRSYAANVQPRINIRPPPSPVLISTSLGGVSG